VFVLATLLGWQLDGWVLLVAAVAFLAGFGYLVSRLKDRDTDDPDDGAVV
jgi:4-hydroxybenzoate polyprenyltransferase